MFLVTVMTIIGGYLGAAFLTARIEAPTAVFANVAEHKPHRVFLVSGLLHADIAVPATPELIARFPFLRSTSIPFENPNLKFVLFGWGSKAFYTTAGSYSDIEPGAVFTAVTGDRSVMRVSAAGALAEVVDARAIDLSSDQMEKLYDGLAAGFQMIDEKPIRISGASLSKYDAFFEGVGHFNIFHPCNQWVNKVLRGAGFKLGVWTPTTQSLLHSLRYFSEK